MLTPDNRSWTPGRLYRELQREHRAMGRDRMKILISACLLGTSLPV
ncbi:MAG: DUF3783 domain-containing protein [Dysosmobacter sp.]